MDSQLVLWIVIATGVLIIILIMAKKFKKDYYKYEDTKLAKKEAEIIELLADENLDETEKARLIEILHTKK